MKNIVSFSLKVILVTAITLALHLFVLHFFNLPLFNDKIILSYLINLTTAILIYSLLFKLKNILKTQLGFLFMGGSFLKFILFFVLLYPIYRADNTISKTELTAFFIPYTITLILELFYISKWLNKME